MRSLNELVRGIACATAVFSLTTVAFHAIDLTVGNEAHGGGGEGDRADGLGNGAGNGRAETASELGGLNAANASNRARDRAAPNSEVAQIGAYRDDMQNELDLSASLAEAHEAVAQDFEDALDGIADLSEEAVSELADLLGLEERD